MPKIMKNGIIYGSGNKLPISTEINETSTHNEIPTAKAVYDYVKNVDDIARTIITLTNETYVKPTKQEACSYLVKNGICTLTLELELVADSNIFNAICVDLPKPYITIYQNAVDRGNAEFGMDNGVALFQLSDTGTLSLCAKKNNPTAKNTRFYISFIYPVKNK